MRRCSSSSREPESASLAAALSSLHAYLGTGVVGYIRLAPKGEGQVGTASTTGKGRFWVYGDRA
jgi:hypothetical protein